MLIQMHVIDKENALETGIVSLLRLQHTVTSSKQFASPEVASLEGKIVSCKPDCKACRYSSAVAKSMQIENQKARIAAELREVVAAMHAGHHKPWIKMDRRCMPVRNGIPYTTNSSTTARMQLS